MNYAWNFFRCAFLLPGFALIITACGNTGPDADGKNTQGTDSSSSVAIGVGSSSNTSINTSQTNSSVSIEGNLSISLTSQEVTEGSYITQFKSGGEILAWPAEDDWPDLQVVVGDDAPLAIPLVFSLTKSFAADTTALIEYDKENSNCADPLYLSKKGVISIPKAAVEFTVNAELYSDTTPEDDCDARFKVSFGDEESRQTIAASGAIKVKDDDKNVRDLVITEILNPGHFFEWALNGSRRYDGSNFVVQQVKGPKVEFKVDKDQLKLIVPAVETGTIADRTVVLSVQPEKSKAYTISFLIHAGLMMPLSSEDTTAGDSDVDTSYVDFYVGVKAYGYQTAYIAPKKLTDLKWIVETKSTENKVVLDGTSLEYLRGGPDIAEEDLPALRNLLQLLPDNRTLVLNPDNMPTLQKYLDDGLLPRIEWDIKIYPNSSVTEDWIYETQQYTYQKISLLSWLKPAPRSASVTLLGLDAKQINQSNLRMVIRQQTDHDRIMQYKPVENVKTEFDFLTQGAYSVSVIDFEKGEIANGVFTLNDETMQIDYQLEIRTIPSALESVSAKKTSVRDDVQQSKTMEAMYYKSSEECGDDRGDGYYVASANQDVEISCTKIFSADELRGDEEGVSRQLIVQVESLEYPSFLPRFAEDKPLKKFKDTWSWSIDTKVDALTSMKKSADGEIHASHKTARSVFTVSPCFTLPKDSEETVKFTAKAKNVGDNQIATYVSAKVADCEELYVVESAKLKNHEDSKNKYLFAHVKTDLNGGYAYISLPYKLTADDKRYKADNNAFGFDFIVKPLKGDETIAKSMKIDSIEMYLQHYQSGVETLLELGTVDTKSTSPKVTITNFVATIDKKDVVQGKSIEITNYKLPIVDSKGIEIPYPANSGYVHLMLKVKINKDADNEGSTKITALHLADNSKTDVVNINSPHLRVLMDMDALKMAMPQHASRFAWDPAVDTHRYGATFSGSLDPAKGGDRWTSPIVWEKIYTNERSAVICPSSSSSSFNSNSSAVSTSSLAASASSSSAHPLCLTSVGDNSTAPTFLDYLDELSLNDISAIHNRTFWEAKNTRWRSILDHAGHNNGLELDLLYVDPDGTVKGDGATASSIYPKKINDLWAKVGSAADEASKKSALQDLIDWIKVNRATIDAIILDGQNRGLAVTKIHLGDSTGMGSGVPTIYKILTEGKLPTHTISGMPSSMGDWRKSGTPAPNQVAPHSDHYHISFKHLEPEITRDD